MFWLLPQPSTNIAKPPPVVKYPIYSSLKSTSPPLRLSFHIIRYGIYDVKYQLPKKEAAVTPLLFPPREITPPR